MPETIIDLGKKVKAKYPGQYDDLADDEVGRRVKAKFPGAYDDFTDIVAKPAQPAPVREGARPVTFGNVLSTILDTTGGDPNIQKLEVPSALVGSSTSKIFSAANQLGMLRAGEGAKVVEGLGGQLMESPVGQMVEGAGKWALDKINLAKIYNKAAGVPAGRKGVEVAMGSGAVKTNPGAAAVRANEEKSALGQIKDAFFAKPGEALRAKVQFEYNRANQAIKSHLGQFKDALDFAVPDLKKAHEAVGAAGLEANEAGTLTATPLKLHDLRSELGSRINWNPDFVTEANETLKDAWIELSKKLDVVGGKTMPKLNKDFQEAYLYQRALKRQLENIETGKKVSDSMARRTVKGAIRAAKVAGPLIGAEEVVRRLP
jgi:hypothetical protein